MSLAQNVIAFAVAGAHRGGRRRRAGLSDGAPGRDARRRAAPRKASDSDNAAPIVEMGLDGSRRRSSPISPRLPTSGCASRDRSLFEGKTLPHGEALAGEIAGDILAFMRTQTLAQIQGVAGLQHLRQDLNERVATRSRGQVREFIIRSLVVQ